MNKLFKIIFDDIKRNKNLYISLILVVVVALIFGTLFINILNNNDKLLVKNEINTFFNKIISNNYMYKDNLLNNFLSNNIYCIIIWIMGLSVIGIPIIICLLFYKSFSLTFTIASLIYSYKIEGIFISFIYIFPHLIINLIIYFITSYYSFLLSIKVIKSIFNKEQFKIKLHIKKYIFIIMISIIILLLTSLYETYIIPYIIKLIY